MAASSEKSSRHSRSNSSPIEDHPFTSQFDGQLCRLRLSESSSLASIHEKLSGLNGLYLCIHHLLQLPFMQKALTREHQQKLFEDALDGSLRLLDVCGSATDVLVQAKECTSRLQLVLRRSFGELKITKEVGLYLNSRRQIRKAAAKCLKDLKRIPNDEREVGSIARVLGESMLTTFEALSSLLSCIAGGNSVQSKSNWSLLLKMVQSKQGEEKNEFEAVEEAVNSLLGGKTSKCSTILQLRWGLEKLESDVEAIQEEVECLSRNLIKSRFSLLNILNH